MGGGGGVMMPEKYKRPKPTHTALSEDKNFSLRDKRTMHSFLQKETQNRVAILILGSVFQTCLESKRMYLRK